MPLSSSAVACFHAIVVGLTLVLLTTSVGPTPVPALAADRIDLPGQASSLGDTVGVAPSAVQERIGSFQPSLIPSESDSHRSRLFLSSFRLPDKLVFAGMTVPVDNWQVRERIEYEFYQFLQEEGESIIMAKRTGRCFPPVERQLAEAGLPDDLKYMLLVESKCVPVAYSRAKASGPWQFIGSTGKRYQLSSNQWRDDRRDLEMSTEAAIKYLRFLKDDTGDWLLAMAAYNAGEDRIKKLLREQRVTDYWKMHYVRETMRYVPRIIAAKEIYSQPEKYLGLKKEDLYAPVATETITIHVKESQRHLVDVAEQNGSYFLELKYLNPHITKDFLPRGIHQLKIPKRDCPTRCFKQDKQPQ